MIKKTIILLAVIVSACLTGCASVPMASIDDDKAKKEFTMPSEDIAGLYIYRNSRVGGALKKTLSIDDVIIGETAPMTYFYSELQPGQHELATESEFSDNALLLDAEGGNNYYVRQYMKFGVFVGGAGLELVSEEEGQKGVLECDLAK